MIIHDKFAYVHFPKTGGHFIIDWLAHCFGGDIGEVPPPRQSSYPFSSDTHLPLVHLEDKSVWKWGIIRNPFDFYVSWHGNHPDGFCFRKFLMDALLDRREVFHQYVDFNKMAELDIGLMTWWFIRMFCDYEPIFNMSLEEIDNLDLKKESIADEILLYENLNKEIERMFKEHIFPLEDWQKRLLRTGRRLNASDHEYWGNCYDEELVKLVEHKDRLIFKMFPHYLYERSSKRTLG